MAVDEDLLKPDATGAGLPSIPETSTSKDIDQARHEESSSDDEDGARTLGQNPPPKPHKVSQRKRQDHAAFALWYEKHRDQVSKPTKTLPREDESKSAARLIHDFEITKIIESPRDYQLELFELAKQKNIIAVLDTGRQCPPLLRNLSLAAADVMIGSGKTLIAALLLRHIIAQEFEDRAQGKDKRVSFFLVRAVPV